MKIRSVLEYAAPVFTSMLTEADKSDIERIKKTVLKILLGPDYIDYEQACTLMKTSSLQVRREHLSLRFALSCLKSPKHKHLFTPRTSTFYNLRNIKSFEIPHTISDRYYSSYTISNKTTQWSLQSENWSFEQSFCYFKTMNYRYVSILSL